MDHGSLTYNQADINKIKALSSGLFTWQKIARSCQMALYGSCTHVQMRFIDVCDIISMANVPSPNQIRGLGFHSRQISIVMQNHPVWSMTGLVWDT